MSPTYIRNNKKSSKNAYISNWHGLKQGNLLDYMEKLSTSDKLSTVDIHLSPSEIFASLAQVNRKAERMMPVLPEDPIEEEPTYWWIN